MSSSQLTKSMIFQRDRGAAWWNETFRVTLGDTGLGHGVGLGDKWEHGAGTWGEFRGQDDDDDDDDDGGDDDDDADDDDDDDADDDDDDDSRMVLSDPNCAVLSDPNPVVPSDPATMSNHQEKQLRWVMAQNSWNEYRNVIDQCQLN